MTHASPGDDDTTNPPDSTPDAPENEDSSRGMELFAAVLLGVAAILTAISAYKAALLDGDALQGYTNSTRTLNNANTFYAQANQTYTQDQTLFVQYASAAKTDAELATYLKTKLMSEELVKAVDWWENTDSASTPFDEDSPYTDSDITEAQGLEKQAGTEFKAGAVADDQGDKFELSSVLLAITLFLGGVATLFKRRRTKVLMLIISTVSLAIGGGALALAFAG